MVYTDTLNQHSAKSKLRGISLGCLIYVAKIVFVAYIVQMKTIPEISAILREAVQNSGLTHTQICEQSGVQRMTLHRMLSGKENFSMSSFLAVTFALKVELMIFTESQSDLLQKFSPNAAPLKRVERKIDSLRNT